MSANPIANSGIELGAFNDMETLYLRIAEARLTAIPKGNVYFSKMLMSTGITVLLYDCNINHYIIMLTVLNVLKYCVLIIY